MLEHCCENCQSDHIIGRLLVRVVSVFEGSPGECSDVRFSLRQELYNESKWNYITLSQNKRLPIFPGVIFFVLSRVMGECWQSDVCSHCGCIEWCFHIWRGKKKGSLFFNRLFKFSFSAIWMIVKTGQRLNLSEAAWL